jgi:hypothetical protein
MLSHHGATEKDLWRSTCCDSAAHVVRKERETDLVSGCEVRACGQGGKRASGEGPGVPFIHPNPSRGTILKSMP